MVNTTDKHYAEINQSFYRAEPNDYIMLRVTSLMGLLGNPSDFTAALRAGLRVHGVEIIVPSSNLETEDLNRHAAIESTLVAHHAVETLLRLFLAHASIPPCPALELARERTPKQFKSRVGKILSNEHLDDLRLEIGQVLFGIPRTATSVEIECRNACVGLFRDLADLWLADAPLYNSLKHGLAAVPGGAELIIGDINVSGVSLEFLERKNDKTNSTATWSWTTQWIDIEKHFSAAILSAYLIENLWSLAKWRYIDAEPPTALFKPAGLRLDDMAGKKQPVRKFMMNRLIETDRKIHS